MGKQKWAWLVFLLLVVPVGASDSGAETLQPVGAVIAVKGDVQVSRDGAWQAAVSECPLFEEQLIRTAASSSAELLFDGKLPVQLNEKSESLVANLLLRARLDKIRKKIAVPGDGVIAEMQVTPLTGVRGAERVDEKFVYLKRDHYWSEESIPAK